MRLPVILLYFYPSLFIFVVDDSVLAITASQLTPANLGGSVVLRCKVSPQIGFTDIKWLQDGLPLTTGYIGTGTGTGTGLLFYYSPTCVCTFRTNFDRFKFRNLITFDLKAV